VARDHDVPGDGPSAPPPLAPATHGRRRTAAEEARTLLAGTNVGTLATLSDDGHPWASLVTFGALQDGSPVLCVSTLAEHGRNLERDARASVLVAETADPRRDPLGLGRVTLAGLARRPAGDAAHDVARAAHLAAVPAASIYVDFRDFSLWVLQVGRIRWVGGYGRMDSATAADYATAEADPTAPAAAGAAAHLNEDHADALVAMARSLAGYSDAARASCTAIDRYGLDLDIETPRGRAPARVGFAEPVTAPLGLRAATVALAHRARS
jgi:putative heme iron utilization protein